MLKRKRPAHSQGQSSIKKKSQRTSDSDLVHEFIESLSDKMDDFQTHIGDANLTDFFSFNQGGTLEDFQDFLDKFPTDELNSLHDNRVVDIPGLLAFQMGYEEAASQENDSTSSKESEEEEQYRFGFTNYEFIAFLASLSPLEYIVIVTLLTILINNHFNIDELEIIFNLLDSLSDSISIMVERRILHKTFKEEKEAKEEKAALQTDFTNLKNQIKELQSQLQSVEDKLNNP